MNNGQYRALIVEDDDKIVEVVEQCLESLGHEHDRAATQSEANELLAANAYCYVLLDLEIPFNADGFARIQNGENLLEQIRAMDLRCTPPIIIMTSHGRDGPDRAVRMMKRGANDYICKPFSNASGDTLDDKIKESLGAACKHPPQHCPILAGATTRPEPEKARPGELTPFQGGELAFYPNRIELLGRKILGRGGSGITRKVLDILSEKRRGKYVAHSGEDLARKVGTLGGQNSVAACVRNLRRNIKAALEAEGISCQPQDVIQSGGRGYRFNEWLSIRRADDDTP